ncbi:MAG: UDP-N-acetylmuramate--L-alanine ligase [Verrucomicrobiota bacterium]
MDNVALRPLSRGSATVILGGVSGSGMIGLARMCLQKGLNVYGCDQHKSEEITELESAGLIFFSESVDPPLSIADLVVCSSALPDDHLLRHWARSKEIPVADRAEMLAALLHDRQVILVVGTHGKTTSAVLMAHALRKLGRDISFYIGAEVPLFGTSAYLGQDELAVVEADESDGSFTCFSPSHLLVLNIEEDHLDHYSGLEEIQQAFRHVADRCTGHTIVCGDDPVASGAFRDNENVTLYGFVGNGVVKGSHWKVEETGSSFTADFGHQREYRIAVALNGRHNASNVLGVITMCIKLDYQAEEVTGLFKDVRGARRRYEVLVSNSYGTVVDDYAHHPTEIQATVAAARKRTGGRLVAVFQPHRFSRTQKLMDKFAGCFDGADAVYLTDVYSAGEESAGSGIGFKLSEVVGSEHESVTFHASFKELGLQIRSQWQLGDTLLVMGAGDINQVAQQIAAELLQAEELQQIIGDEGRCSLYEPMSRHTTLGVGGPTDVWLTVNSERALAEIIYYTKKRTKSFQIIGRGSNLLVRDGGIRGICCHLEGGEFNRLEFDGKQISCGAGVRLKNIVFEAKKRHLGGLEFMEGIPGNLGGALCMNAGAMQSWTFEVVQSVRVMDLDGNIREVSREEIEVGYRHVPLFEDHMALSAVLRAAESNRETIDQNLKSYSQKRWASQPAKPSSGCSFKNPHEIPAGKLIEELGLKEKKIGGAAISAVHGNFIVNDGGATAENVLELIDLVKREASEKRGIQLETEVIILGE